ncbi:MAG: valine--tRNA ligase [Candidatus Hodarchaeota archaeon]
MTQEHNYPKRFKFREIQKKWIGYWKENKIYKFDKEKKAVLFTIDTPPPFVSGVLHIGQYLNYAWIDFVARYRRMKGDHVYFPQGWDSHGLPVELAVQKSYGISKDNRELFLEKCREWVEKNIKKMTIQLDELGYSTDWDYTYRTMNDSYLKKVQVSLLDFYERGLLYREKFPTHFCVNCETSVAKAEVGYEEELGKLWYIKLPLVGREAEYITIATTRPEYMEACVAVLINPRDDRYYDLSAAEVQIPFTDRRVRIFMDEGVDMSFGTGIVYVCTYGDEMDIKWKIKYDLDEIQIFTENGHMNENSKYQGLTIMEAREKVVEDLEKMGLIEKIEDYEHNLIIHSERSSCRKPIEYLPVFQWFINVRDFTDEIIESGEKMNWYPEKQKQRLIDWARGLDWNWVISRQRLFGTPIPFWYCQECNEIIPPKREDLPLDPTKTSPYNNECPKCKSKKIIGEKDVCDCWIDSSITPLEISKWTEDPDFFKRAYMNAKIHRSQGYEIIRTWLFYSLFRCKVLTGKAPFYEAMINGMVAGPDGRHMSKSLGNYISPEDVMPEFGTDAIRYWAAMGSLGDDYPFEFTWINLQTKEPVSNEIVLKELKNLPEEKFKKKYRRKYEQLTGASRFLTKIWNAYRLIYLSQEIIELNDLKIKNEDLKAIDCYYFSEFNKHLETLEKYLDGYNWHEAVMLFRTFFWNDICDNYIEAIKHRFYSEDIGLKKLSLKIALNLFYKLLIINSIIMPFISEEIYSILYKPLINLHSIHLDKWPTAYKFISKELSTEGKIAIEIIKTLRNMKSNLQIPLNQEVKKVIIITNKHLLKNVEEDIKNTIRIVDFQIVESDKESSTKGIPDLKEIIEDLNIKVYFFI